MPSRTPRVGLFGVLITALCAASACASSSASGGPDTAADTVLSGSDTTVGTDAKTETDAAPASDALPVDVSCQKTGTYGDGLHGDDTCWAPPAYYCSAGASTVIVKGCSADGTLCCSFESSCIPCGWTSCFEHPEGPGCDQAEPAHAPDGCAGVTPHHEPICLD